MKRQICKWCLLGLNILLITLLTLLSCIFLYFSLAHPTELFGHTALLLEPESGAGRELCLLECRPAVFAEGDQLLIEDADGTPRLYTAIRMSDDSLAAASDSGDTFPLFSPSSTPTLLGKAVWSSSWLGGLLYSAIQPENIPLTYSLIGGGFLLCLLALAGFYLFSSRRASAPLREDPPTEDTPTEGDLPEAPPIPQATGWRTWNPPAHPQAPEEEASPPAAVDIFDVNAREDIKIYHPASAPLPAWEKRNGPSSLSGESPLPEPDMPPLPAWEKRNGPSSLSDESPLPEPDMPPLPAWEKRDGPSSLPGESPLPEPDMPPLPAWEKRNGPSPLPGESPLPEPDMPALLEREEQEEIGSVLADIEKLFDEATRF